ncbi:MAG: hypothetical protein IPK23_15120 [Rhizobiales bacterium]|nr:hypothetical protein [Hyphomicrobiales bacterium]
MDQRTLRVRENAVDVRRQPYWKYAQPNITMQPAEVSGAGITVTFSAPVLTPGHVGVSFRYCGRELICATVVSPTQGTFNIIETLPPTYNVTVNSTADFRIGEICIGASSDCQALIVDITSSTVMKCIYIKRYAGFTTSEKITSESAVTTWTSHTFTDEAATAFWDEAMMSDVRGWPASVSQDRSRVIFCDFPLVGQAVAESAIGLLQRFPPRLAGDGSHPRVCADVAAGLSRHRRAGSDRAHRQGCLLHPDFGEQPAGAGLRHLP